MQKGIKNSTNRLWLICALAGVLALLGFVALNANLQVRGVEERLIEKGRLSDQGMQAIAVAAASGSEIEAFLENNPGLPTYLAAEILAQRVNAESGLVDVKYFSNVSRSLRLLLESTEVALVRQSLTESPDGVQNIVAYVGDILSDLRLAGTGSMSNLDEANQRAAGQAIKLLASLDDRRDIRQDLTEVASWYKHEMNAGPGSTAYQEWLLQYAWELSLVDLGLDLNDADPGTHASLKKDTDLARLLNHSNNVVVKNAANLIAYFVPQNAITALRFQLIRSDDNKERFLMLNAIKLYGEQRSQIEPQLKKMLRLTRETELQKKILETINHLNGRLGGLSQPS